jgi:hypothetical protein
VSPGAWVALRDGGPKLKGDYSFLMRRLPGPQLKSEQKVGPDDQRYGAWALTLAKGDQVAFAPDADFVRSLKNAKVRVTYLDRGEGTFRMEVAGKTLHGTLANSGRWKTAEIEAIPGQIVIQTTTDLTLHMVEVAR